jgi:hypothetical protein
VKKRDYFACPEPDCDKDLGFVGSFIAGFIGFLLAGGIVS